MKDSDDLDQRLQQLYCKLPKEQPSPELDEKILAAASVGAKKRLSWYVPFSMAASVVMVSSLVLYLSKQPQQLEQAITPSESPQRVAESKAAAPINDAVTANESDTLLGGSSSPSSLPTEDASLPVKAKSTSSVAMDDKAVDELKDFRSEPRQNYIDDQPKEIKEEVANYSPSPQPVIAKQDVPQRQESDNRSSLEEINQPVVADSAMPQQRALAAAPPISADAIAPLAKMQTAEKKEAAGKAKVALTKPIVSVMEGVSFGMNRAQLLAKGFTCQLNVCSKILNPSQQVSYWGIPASQAALKVLLHSNKVSQFVLMPQVDINTVVKALELLGVATNSVCDEQKNTVIKRVVNGNLLQVYTQEKSVNVVICAEN
jgi:hypothetical protein